MSRCLTPELYDGVVSALTGNGVLCTTVGPTGYHVSRDRRTDTAHRTQYFVMAGRRRSGPRHPLLDLGTVTRQVRVDGQASEPRDWEQEIEVEDGRVWSRARHAALTERTMSSVALTANLFCAQTELTNDDQVDHEVVWRTEYAFGESDANVTVVDDPLGVHLSYRCEDHLGDVFFGMVAAPKVGRVSFSRLSMGGAAEVALQLKAGQSVTLTSWVAFSDRMAYQFPPSDFAEIVDLGFARHSLAWTEFWQASEVVTGDETVDAFRRMALYTLRCQMTPWSIGPTLSEPYWGGGAFHDELYPFFGLLSSNHPDLAARMPYFRLTTLPQAVQRARARGALYPWSSTEHGEERDPNGLWLTERFHLGQFAACAWALWLTERDRVQLDDLYPVLRELARYFELDMLERDAEGRLRTRACVDFDESVGQVTNGPFTICAAIDCLEYAANAADELGRDQERASRWRALAQELRGNLPMADSTYGIPDGKPLHYSIVGPVFPFRVDTTSDRARRSAGHIHTVCRSTRGWKSGLSEPYEGSNWMWTAGHLAIVHALLGSADLAWEAIRLGPASAGPFLSPNEHLDRTGRVQVPWFTTGCGAWLYGLNALFVQVDEEGTRLLPVVSADLANARFANLRAHAGVLVSGRFNNGVLAELSATAPAATAWRFRIPEAHAAEERLAGAHLGRDGRWLVAEVDLPAGRRMPLLRS